jgi:hypothetical protein
VVAVADRPFDLDLADGLGHVVQGVVVEGSQGLDDGVRVPGGVAAREDEGSHSLGDNQPWSVEEIELDPPGPGEVLVKLAASGMCHSDEHLVTGDLPFALPIIGGHEGAGVVRRWARA